MFLICGFAVLFGLIFGELLFNEFLFSLVWTWFDVFANLGWSCFCRFVLRCVLVFLVLICWCWAGCGFNLMLYLLVLGFFVIEFFSDDFVYGLNLGCILVDCSLFWNLFVDLVYVCIVWFVASLTWLIWIVCCMLLAVVLGVYIACVDHWVL